MEIFIRCFSSVISRIHKIMNYPLYKSGVILFGVPRVIHRKKLQLAKGVRINTQVFINAAGGVSIEENVTLSHGVTILSTGYDLSNWTKNKKLKAHVDGFVTIEQDCWLCANVTVLPGVTIASGAVVAAGAVVTQSLSTPNALYGGVPARFIKDL